MTTVQDVCSSQLLTTGLENLKHNQTIYRASEGDYHVLLKCVEMDRPVSNVGYYVSGEDSTTLVVAFGRIDDEELTDVTVVNQLPASVKEIETLLKRLLAIKLATKV